MNRFEKDTLLGCVVVAIIVTVVIIIFSYGTTGTESQCIPNYMGGCDL